MKPPQAPKERGEKMAYAGSRNTWTPRRVRGAMTDEEQLESDAGITACPQPRRAVLLPGSPGENARSMPSSPHSTVEDQAREDLRELMGGFTEGDARNNSACGKDTFHSSGRSLSSVSTSAGATPILDSWPSTVPSTPQFPRLDEVDFEDDEKENSSTTPAGFGGVARLHRQKIFVGGIPQDLDQDEVKQIMSQIAPVKKAWLQKHKESAPGAANNLQRHRGFGFVIFNDAASVDLLLGDKPSRYLSLPDGRRIEVKRAVSSAEMQKNVEIDVGNGPRQPQPKLPLQWNGGQRPQPGQPCPPCTSQSRNSDPRQSPPHGGFRTPDHSSSSGALLGTPPRVPPMLQGRLTPVPLPPSPWNQSATPPPMMAAVPMMGGSVMVMPLAPGPTNQASSSALPVGVLRRPQQQVVPMPPQQQVVPTPPQFPHQQQQQGAPPPQFCGVPWSMELVPGNSNAYAVAPGIQSPAQTGSQSVPCPGGPPTGWAAAHWEVAYAAAQQQQQMLRVQQQQQLIVPPQQQLTLPSASPMHQQSPQQKSRELDLIREDHPLQMQLLADIQQQPNGQLQAPVRSQTPISPGSPQHWWQIEEALRQAMPDHYDE